MQEDSTQNVSRETLTDLTISFEAKYNDIFDGLDSTDTADGSNKKSRNLFLLLAFLMCIQLVGFVYTKSGIALIFALLMGGMALLVKNKSQKFNKEIAQEFEKEGTQKIVLGENALLLNEKEVPYSEIAKVYELKRCFSVVYQGNHIYIIPKNVLDQQQTEEFASRMKDKVGNAYQNMLQK